MMHVKQSVSVDTIDIATESTSKHIKLSVPAAAAEVEYDVDIKNSKPYHA